MDIKAGNYCCSMDQEPVIYIENQYSEGSLLSSLVISTTRQSTCYRTRMQTDLDQGQSQDRYRTVVIISLQQMESM